MLFFLLYFIIYFFPHYGENKEAGLSYQTFLEDKVLYYQFDSKKYDLKANSPITDSERRKFFLYCYFELQKAKNSDAYVDLVDMINDVIKPALKKTEFVVAKSMDWAEFEKEYKKQGVHSLPFIGVAFEDRKMKSIIGFGAKGVFQTGNEDINMIINPGLNDFRDLFYGKIVELNDGDLKELAKKSSKFRIQKIPIVSIEDFEADSIKIKFAYAFVPPNTELKEETPSLNDFLKAFTFYQEGEDDLLLRLFCETTYLSDCKTTLSQWIESEVLNYYETEVILFPLVKHHYAVYTKLQSDLSEARI